MLVYEQDGNILSILSKLIEGMFNRRGFGLLVHYKEVLLRLWCWSYMLGRLDSVAQTIAEHIYANSSEKQSRYRVLASIH
jgi:hypothetical protein